ETRKVGVSRIPPYLSDGSVDRCLCSSVTRSLKFQIRRCLMKWRPCVFGLVASVVVAVLAIGCSRSSTPTPYDEHEPASRARYNAMQTRLTNCSDKACVDLLDAQLDAQLKLEDYLIKFREAEHAKLAVWTPLFASAIVSLVTTLLTLRFSKR